MIRLSILLNGFTMTECLQLISSSLENTSLEVLQLVEMASVEDEDNQPNNNNKNKSKFKEPDVMELSLTQKLQT